MLSALFVSLKCTIMEDADRKRRRRDGDDSDDDESFSSTSSSASISHDHERNREKKKRKRHKKKQKKDKKTKSSKRRKKDKKRKRKRQDDDESSSNSEDSREDRRKDRKRRRRESKKRHEEPSRNDNSLPSHSNSVAQALHTLLLSKPEFASELPIILIRLAGGTTFDLRQVTDPAIASGLQSLFTSLETYGVRRDDMGRWMFQPPPSSSRRRDELLLLRVLRLQLNEVGLTMDKIANFEHRLSQEEKQNVKQDSKKSATPSLQQNSQTAEELAIRQQTFQFLSKFQSKDPELGLQLIGLCKMIAEGESVSLDGLPNEELKDALESLFVTCGLEKSEMEEEERDSEDDQGEDDGREGPLMGYGLPEDASDSIQAGLATIMAACRKGPPKRHPVGPMRRPTTEQEEEEANALYARSINDDSEIGDEEEDGPLLPGQARKMRGPMLPPEAIRAQAEYREMQLKATAAGIDMPIQGRREEWMVVPGKYDFLSNIKSGQPIKSRGFQNKKSPDDGKASAPIHPAIQAEMDAIMQAHEDARGPSLMDQHRATKQKEKDAAAKSGKQKEWKWSRDKDLDAGRRVDKDALGMILGGAAVNLKTKFQGGFNR